MKALKREYLFDSDLSYEDLFEQTTEDISTYLWAIQGGQHEHTTTR